MINSSFSYNTNALVSSNLEQESINKANNGIYSENQNQNISHDFQSNSVPSLNIHSFTFISFKDLELYNDPPIEKQNNSPLEEDDFLENFLNEDKGVNLTSLDDQVYASLAKNDGDSLEDFLASKEEDTFNAPLQITISQQQEAASPVQADEFIKPPLEILKATTSSTHITYFPPATVELLHRLKDIPDRTDLSLNFKRISLDEEHSQETLKELAWAAQNEAFAHIKQNDQGETEVKLAARYADLLEKHNIKEIKINNNKGEEIEKINVDNIKINKFSPEEINSICQQIFKYIQSVDSQQKQHRRNEDSKKINEASSHILSNLLKNKIDEIPKAKSTDPLFVEKVAINVLKMLSILVKKQREMERIKEERAEEKDREFWENKHLIIQKYIQKFEILRDSIKEQTLVHSIISNQNQSYLKTHAFKIASH
ncbi:hypothetical protein [Candidatus Protochlamydia phocaeensis]|uniref:hypothetical protein n=1 Tax=Candidatus Protochlamydia phocaeensis TaxID=1414722 RepID=UPI0008395AD7|nr:hypothetical protein [Candidatus Protochlamydia phocaeensis]